MSEMRSWQEIAQEAGRERDPEKRQRLTEELDHALEERAKKLKAPCLVNHPNPNA